MSDRADLLRQLDRVGRQLDGLRRENASAQQGIDERLRKMADLEKTRDSISRALGLIA